MQNTNLPTLIHFLLKFTNTNHSPSKNEIVNNKAAKIFERKLKNAYHNWWTEKMTSIENRKLSFFYTYKKTFKFEPYLDTVPRHIRLFTTRLRTSSHNYPIEVLRYNKPVIERQDRKCTICNNNQVGDELHYLLKCTNYNILNTRQTNMKELREAVDQFENFSDDCIIQYCLLLHDYRIHNGMARYVKAIAETYKEETMEKQTIPITYTRCGRLVKKPEKLNL